VFGVDFTHTTWHKVWTTSAASLRFDEPINGLTGIRRFEGDPQKNRGFAPELSIEQRQSSGMGMTSVPNRPQLIAMKQLITSVTLSASASDLYITVVCPESCDGFVPLPR
jgi:hypothetical protein